MLLPLLLLLRVCMVGEDKDRAVIKTVTRCYTTSHTSPTPHLGCCSRGKHAGKKIKFCCRLEPDNVPIPNLNEPSGAFRNNLASRDAANIIIAAAAQLSTLVAPPPMSIFNIVSGVSTVTSSTISIDLTSIQHFHSAALRVCLELSVTEILE